mgnify:CR=1 FL=1
MIANPNWLPDGAGGALRDGAVEPFPEHLDVLLVEDNPGDVDLVRIYLEQDSRARVELRCADSLRAARTVLGDSDPDLVLLDLGLPDGSGVEVIRTVRRLAADIPIVVLTGQDDPDAGLQALQCDAQDYLVKSQLNATMLSRSIRYAVERHRWQQQYRQQLASSPDGIVVLDEWGTVRFANGSAAVLLGGAPSSLDELPRVLRVSSGPTDVTLPTGRIVEARTANTVWQGMPAQLITLRDMTERREAERALSRLTDELRLTNKRLEELVGTDPLTGVYNRRGLEEVLGREMDRLHRTGDGLVAVLVDCDDFKGINDGYGHAVGDAALKALTAQVRDALRTGDHVGRVGGDEFLLRLPETTIREGMAVAEKLRHAIKATRIPVGDGSIALSASLAAGAVEPDVVAIEQILSALGPTLKRSKGGGKDRVSGDGVADSVNGRAVTLLDPGRLDLGVALQTIRRLEDETAVGFEALTRGPPGELRLPAELFQAAFEQDVLTTLDLRALTSSLSTLRDVGGNGWYHVNLFPSTVLNTPVDRLARLFAEARGSACVCVELSEQQFLGDPTYLREPLQALRESGVRVAIDDVGFGRSSIEALLLLEPDVVKVDRRCVQRIASHEGERRRLQRLMDMLLAVGADVIIEGVETPAERDVLKEMGVEYAQGFLWDEPSSRTRMNRT